MPACRLGVHAEAAADAKRQRAGDFQLNPQGLAFGYTGCFARTACELPMTLRLIPSGTLAPGATMDFEPQVERPDSPSSIELAVATSDRRPALPPGPAMFGKGQRRAVLRARIQLPPVIGADFAIIGTATIVHPDGGVSQIVETRLGGRQ